MARALIIAALLLLPATTAAQGVCGAYAKISERLVNNFNENIVGRGIDSQNRMFEIWTGDDGWTITMTSAQMITCVMVVGQKGTSWENVAKKPRGAPAGGN